jgi:hypothetical protein
MVWFGLVWLHVIAQIPIFDVLSARLKIVCLDEYMRRERFAGMFALFQNQEHTIF